MRYTFPALRRRFGHVESKLTERSLYASRGLRRGKESMLKKAFTRWECVDRIVSRQRARHAKEFDQVLFERIERCQESGFSKDRVNAPQVLEAIARRQTPNAYETSLQTTSRFRAPTEPCRSNACRKTSAF